MPKVRLNGLKYIIKMVNYESIRIGMHEYKELEAKEQVRKDMQKFPKKGGFTGRVAMIIALSLMRQSQHPLTHLHQSHATEPSDHSQTQGSNHCQQGNA